MNYYIAYEVNDPINMVFYNPISMDTNTLKIRLLDDVVLNPNKEYKFILSLEGINLALVGKPIVINKNESIILIKESRIELRRHPRITVPNNLVKVQIDNFHGVLNDISLGGCKITLNSPILSSLLNKGYEKVVKFILPDNSHIEIPVQIVWVSKYKRQIACAFKEKNAKVLELYRKITNLIQNSLKEE